MNRFPFLVAALLLAGIPFSASVLLATWAPLAAQGTSTAPSGGNGTFYISTYSDQIRVLDERTRTVIGQIQTQNGIPGRFVVSADRERLYVSDATMLHIETIDLAERRSIDTFTLNEGIEQFRIRRFRRRSTGDVRAHPGEDEDQASRPVRNRTEHHHPLRPPEARGHGHDPVARWP